MKKLEGVAIALAAMLFVVLAFLRIANAPITGMNAVRPVGPLALAKGLPIYHAPGQGIEIAGINGPIAAMVGIPMVLAADPYGVMVLGSLLSALYALVPLALLVWMLVRRHKADARLAAMLFLGFALFALRSRALSLSVFLVHADAPALGFATLSVAAFIVGKKGNRRDLLAATFATAAALCKITLVPLPCALVLYAGWTEGGKAAVKLLGWHGLVGMVAVALSLAVFGTGVFNVNVTTVAASPWVASLTQAGAGPALTTGAKIKVLIAAFNELLQEYGEVFWLLVALAMVRRSWKAPWVLALLCAICLLPPSLLGRVKGGGDVNTQSPFVFFALLTLLLLYWDVAAGASLETAKRARHGLASGLLLLTVLLGHKVYEWSLTLPFNRDTAPQVAFRYLKAHPGSVYFPDQPLAHLMAEGRLYHSWATVSEYWTNTNRIGTEQFVNGTPQPPRPVAFLGKPYGPTGDYFPGFVATGAVTDLPGWTVLERLSQDSSRSLGKANDR